ncbi:MAG: Gfo/Idh/MocA family oxidoreductase [Aquificaceae bacterium]|nr:Gfo/Idh/MocA family oxidoreductase [Aquificaceae bacterium]
MHILLVGLGNMGNKYFWKLEQMGESMVLCDIDSSKDRKTHPFYCHFGDVREALRAVVVAVDPRDHVSIAKEFLQRGVPVLLEKPPALSSEEFRTIKDFRGLFISEVESYSVCANFIKKPKKSLRIERFGRGRGYLSPLWDLAWHDLYLLQRLSPNIELKGLDVEDGVWVLKGIVEDLSFTLKVAWEHPQPRRMWWIDEDLLLDFGEEKVYEKGKLLKEDRRDKLRLMLEDFLKGCFDSKGVERAYTNLKLLESLS